MAHTDVEYAYGVDDGYFAKTPEIVKVTIKRRTAKQTLLTSTGSAWGFRTTISPSETHLSPTEAIRAYISKCESSVRTALLGLKEAEDALAKAKAFAEKMKGGV